MRDGTIERKQTMKTLRTAICLQIICSILAPRAGADERDDKIKALEQRLEAYDQQIRRLEERLGAQEKKEAALSKAPPLVSVGANGFVMQSSNADFALKLKGVLQVDSRSYFDDGGIQNNDTFLLRRVRPIFEGKVFRDFDFRLMPEFGGSSSPSIRDAWINYQYIPELQLRVGKFKQPVGLEQLQSASSTMFTERSLASTLTPSRDIGVQLHGEALDGVLGYAAGIFNGIGDGRTTSNVDFDDEKAFAARIFAKPFQKMERPAVQKLGIGIAGSFANMEGALGLPQNNGYVTDGQQQFFAYRTSSAAGRPNVMADGDHWRLSPQASWYFGPFSFIGEYIVSSQRLRRTDTGQFGTMNNRAWHVAAGYVLTGEDASEKGVTPRKPFDAHANSWGAFEVAVRYAQLNVDDDAFPLFADPTTSASEAAAWAVGLNWYLNKNLRASMNFFHTDFEDGRTGAVTRQDENAVFTRLQLSF